jgi:hypothetical protein
MANIYKGPERREFLRCDFNKPVKYSTVNVVKDQNFTTGLADAISKNLSASGIYFITKVGKVPDISSLLVLDLDYKTATICKEIEERVLILGNKLIGRVVRIEDNEDGTCGIGVAFVKKSDADTKEVKDIENILTKE